MEREKQLVNFGCGLTTGPAWINYDASPTLRLQRLRLVGSLFQRLTNPVFPKNVQFGDVVSGLPLASGSCDLVFSSHVLEHLARNDLLKALDEVYRILKPGGVFRSVLPDLEREVTFYLKNGSTEACSDFMLSAGLGLEARPRGWLALIKTAWGNTQHHWMWDYKGIEKSLNECGFTSVRRAEFKDSQHSEFREVELADRWEGCLGFECEKPE